MKNRRIILLPIFTLILVSCNSTTKQKETTVFKPEFDFSKVEKFKNSKSEGLIINDFDSIFTTPQRKELSNLLYDYNIITSKQIVIVTIVSSAPYSDIQKFATDLGNYWGVGDDKKDNGILILFCKPEGKIAISTGLGTEMVLTDKICNNIIEHVMIPEFKNENYYEGIKKGVTQLIEKWD